MSERRRGSTVLEAALAVVLLALVFMAVAHLLAVTARQRRETQWQRLATLEAANVLERLMARPWEELTTENLTSLELSSAAGGDLPEAQLSVAVQPIDGPPSAKRIQVQIDWVNLAGQRGRPVQLIAWRHGVPTD